MWLSCAAQAQLSASIAADSDYRFRGVSLSHSKPTLRLSGNYDSASGWYAGASATCATVTQGERYAQLLGYAGHATRLEDGRAIDFGVTVYRFVGEPRYDFAEAYAGLHAQAWSLRVNLSPDYFGRHVQTAYVDASAQARLGDAARLFGHVGVLAPLGGSGLHVANANHVRADLRAGAGWVVGDLDLQLAWTTVDRGGPFPAVDTGRRSAWIFSASYSF